MDSCRHFDWLTTSVGGHGQVTFAFHESSVPAARAGAIFRAESKAASHWNNAISRGGTAKATALLGDCLMPL